MLGNDSRERARESTCRGLEAAPGRIRSPDASIAQPPVDEERVNARDRCAPTKRHENQVNWRQRRAAVRERRARNVSCDAPAHLNYRKGASTLADASGAGKQPPPRHIDVRHAPITRLRCAHSVRVRSGRRSPPPSPTFAPRRVRTRSLGAENRGVVACVTQVAERAISSPPRRDEPEFPP